MLGALALAIALLGASTARGRVVGAACVRACASARMSMHLRRTLTSRPRAATSVAISTFLCPDLNMCSAASRSCCHNQAKTHITT